MEVEIDRSMGEDVLHQAAIESLRANRIEPKFLYVTPRQAHLWREVSLRHSPFQFNPEFGRIYGDSFHRIAGQVSSSNVHLIGLGCGTGQKELDLFTRLHRGRRRILFSAIDISRELVLESAQKLTLAGAISPRHLVSDLIRTDVCGWLASSEDLPRIYTCFGLFPNFKPAEITRFIRSVLRPGDIFLASVHLVPVPADNPDSLGGAMQCIQPQYDNPETHAWLAEALVHWKLSERVGPPEFQVDEIEGIPAFLASSRWKNDESFKQWGCLFSPSPHGPLHVFASLRYTPALFEKKMHEHGLIIQLLAMTTCRQEGIWCIRSA